MKIKVSDHEHKALTMKIKISDKGKFVQVFNK